MKKRSTSGRVRALAGDEVFCLRLAQVTADGDGDRATTGAYRSHVASRLCGLCQQSCVCYPLASRVVTSLWFRYTRMRGPAGSRRTRNIDDRRNGSPVVRSAAQSALIKT